MDIRCDGASFRQSTNSRNMNYTATFHNRIGPSSFVFSSCTHAYNCVQRLYATDHVVGPRKDSMVHQLYACVDTQKLVKSTHVISHESKCLHLDYKL